MTMITPIYAATLADVLAWAKGAGESPDAIYELKKIPARLGLQDDEFHLVSADEAHFERVVAPSPYGAVSRRSGDLEAARRRGNARVRALLGRFRAGTAPQAVLPPGSVAARADWDALIAWVEAREGFAKRGAPWTQGQHRSLTMPRARFAVAPSALTQDLVDALVPSLRVEQRDTLCRSIRLLNRLRACVPDHPEIAHLVPPADLSVPPGSGRARRIEWKNFPPVFRADFDVVARRTLGSPDDLMADAEARIAAGEDPGQVFADLEEQGRSERRVPENHVAALSGYRGAVTWLVRAAEDRGTNVGSLRSLREVMTYPVIKAATDDQVARSHAASDLKDPVASDTLKGRLTSLRTLARYGLRDDALVRLIDGQTRLSVTLPRSKVRAADLDAEQMDADVIAALLRGHPHLAVTLVNAPERLATAADGLLARAASRRAEDEALRLYGAAAAWALQMSRPLRTSNLRNVRLRALPEVPSNLTWLDKRRTSARLHFRAGEVKNATAVAARIVGPDATILGRWVEEVRPRLMTLRSLDEDNVYLFPGEALPDELPGLVLPRGALAPSSFNGLWHLGGERLGVRFGAHRARHAVATLILAMRPGDYSLVASVLGDWEGTVRRHYGRDSGEAASAQVREELLRQHPDLMRAARRRYDE